MPLPNFFVIGAAKSGTTSLYHYLAQHPQVYVSPVKETNHFASAEEAQWRPRIAGEDYAALFDGVTDEIAIGEVSPLYLISRVAPARIRSEVPGARILAILRDPVERAYSGYLMQVRKGRERRPIEECFEPGDIYVEGGFYTDDLARWFELFERQRIKICLFDDLVAEPHRLMADIFAFLGVDDGHRVDVSVRHNVGGLPRRRWLAYLANSRLGNWLRRRAPRAVRRLGRDVSVANLEKPPAMPAEARRRLQTLYRADTLRLQELIGRDLSAWL